MPVVNKIDLGLPERAEEIPDILKISLKTGSGLDRLIETVGEFAARELAVGEAPQITRARHRRELAACEAALAGFLDGSLEELELRAEDLRQAAHALGRITGRVDVEDVLDRIFGAFCIGK